MAVLALASHALLALQPRDSFYVEPTLLGRVVGDRDSAPDCRHPLFDFRWKLNVFAQAQGPRPSFLPLSYAVESSVNNGSSLEMEMRMAQLRAQLNRDGQACREARKRWADWRTHLRAHPWLACGAAAVVGYVLVPQSRKSVNHAQIAPPATPVRTGGLVNSLASALVRRAAQQAIGIGAAWALERLRAGAMNGSQHGADPIPSEAHDAAAYPSEYAHD